MSQSLLNVSPARKMSSAREDFHRLARNAHLASVAPGTNVSVSLGAELWTESVSSVLQGLLGSAPLMDVCLVRQELSRTKYRLRSVSCVAKGFSRISLGRASVNAARKSYLARELEILAAYVVRRKWEVEASKSIAKNLSFYSNSVDKSNLAPKQNSKDYRTEFFVQSSGLHN